MNIKEEQEDSGGLAQRLKAVNRCEIDLLGSRVRFLCDCRLPGCSFSLELNLAQFCQREGFMQPCITKREDQICQHLIQKLIANEHRLYQYLSVKGNLSKRTSDIIKDLYRTKEEFYGGLQNNRLRHRLFKNFISEVCRIKRKVKTKLPKSQSKRQVLLDKCKLQDI